MSHDWSVSVGQRECRDCPLILSQWLSADPCHLAFSLRWLVSLSPTFLGKTDGERADEQSKKRRQSRPGGIVVSDVSWGGSWGEDRRQDPLAEWREVPIHCQIRARWSRYGILPPHWHSTTPGSEGSILDRSGDF